MRSLEPFDTGAKAWKKSAHKCSVIRYIVFCYFEVYTVIALVCMPYRPKPTPGSLSCGSKADFLENRVDEFGHGQRCRINVDRVWLFFAGFCGGNRSILLSKKFDGSFDSASLDAPCLSYRKKALLDYPVRFARILRKRWRSLCKNAFFFRAHSLVGNL